SLLRPRQPPPPLFPSTTLFRSKQEACTRIRPTFYNEQGLALRQIICTCSGGIGARSSRVLHFFEQVRAENRSGFNLWFWSAIVLGHDVYLRLSGQSRRYVFTNFIIATFSHAAGSRWCFRYLNRLPIPPMTELPDPASGLSETI